MPLRHEENGLLVDFFDVEEIAPTATAALADPARYRALRQRARRTVIDFYDLCTLALPTQLRLLKEATEPAGPYVWKRSGKRLDKSTCLS